MSSDRRSMSRGQVLFIALLLCCVVLVVATSAYMLLPLRQTSEVAMPADDATPEQVVAAYLDALDAHDCEIAEALTTDDARESADSWCSRVASLDEISVGDDSPENPSVHGLPENEPTTGVPVTFDLDWRLLRSDGSMPEGATTWGYLLTRADAQSPWRIFSQGVG